MCPDISVTRPLPTRSLALSRETITQEAILGLRGNFEQVPRRAVTLGMRELLGAERVLLYFFSERNASVLRKGCFGPVTAQVPGSLFQGHPNVTVYYSPEVVEPPLFVPPTG